MEKVTRIIRLFAIIAVSAGSLLLSACGGKERITPEAGSEPSSAAKDGGVQDAPPDITREMPPPPVRKNPPPTAAVDAGTDKPDSELWNVICE